MLSLPEEIVCMTKFQKGQGRTAVTKEKPKKSLSTAKSVVVSPWYDHNRVLVAALIVIPLIVYIKVIGLDFTRLDDSIFIIENANYNKDISNIPVSFGRGLFNPETDIYYRPIFLVDFIIESQLFGVNPAGYHFTNLLFHLVSVVLLFYFLNALKIRKLPAFVLSLLFALHPVLTQAVAWIPGRNDLLLMIFFLSSVLTVFKYLDKPGWKWLVLQVVFILLALFTKETAVIIPVILLALSIFVRHAAWRNWLTLAVTWAGAVILWFIVRAGATLVKQEQSLQDLLKNGVERIPALIQYLGKIFFPFNLSVFPAISHITIWWGVPALAILVGLIVYSRSYFKPLTIIGLFWFLVFLGPVLIVPPSLNDQVFEHRLYIPIVGILLMLSQTRLFFSGSSLKFTGRNGEDTDSANRYEADPEIPMADKRAESCNKERNSSRSGQNRGSGGYQDALKSNFKRIMAVIVLLVYAGITFSRIGNFKDSLTFWTYAVRDNESSAYAQMMLGLRMKDTADMRARFMKAYSLNPREKMLNYLIGKLALDANDLTRAERHFRKEMEISQIPDNYFSMARVCFLRNSLDSAAWFLERTIETDPMHPQANYNLSLLYQQLGRKADAQRLVSTMQQKGLQVPPELSR